MDLVGEIKASLINFVQKAEPMPNADLRFIQRPLEDLDNHLLKVILPEVNKFKRSLSKFIFKSPLNFIMVEEDFNQFYQTFYHAKTLI